MLRLCYNTAHPQKVASDLELGGGFCLVLHHHLQLASHDLATQRATQPLAPLQVAGEFSKKTAMGQAQQDPDLPRSASNVLGKVQSLLCLNNRVAKQVEVQAGQVNFKGQLAPLTKIYFVTYVAPCHNMA